VGAEASPDFCRKAAETAASPVPQCRQKFPSGGLSEPQFGQYIKDSRLDKTITITKTGLFLTLYSGTKELKAGDALEKKKRKRAA